jgi:hypothetical protein
MLREIKGVATDVTSIAIITTFGVAFLGAIGLILARSAWRDWRGK